MRAGSAKEHDQSLTGKALVNCRLRRERASYVGFFMAEKAFHVAAFATLHSVLRDKAVNFHEKSVGISAQFRARLAWFRISVARNSINEGCDVECKKG
jgi:hypothetical protein